MQNLALDAITAATGLLKYYSYDVQDQVQQERLDHWLRTYPVRWVRLALIEALYQGRYKTVSVDQLLALWQRRGQPLYHFNPEFESLVCHDFPHVGSDSTGSNSDRPVLKSEQPQRDLEHSGPAPPTPRTGGNLPLSHHQPSTAATVVAEPKMRISGLMTTGQGTVDLGLPKSESSGFFAKLMAIAKHQP